jgi:hypothetical protein
MVVRIRFPKGYRREQRAGKNAHLAAMAAGLMAMAAVSCLLLAAWRLTADLNWTDEFVISTGFFSHWQVWLALTIVTTTASVRLWRYIRASEIAEQHLEKEPSVRENPQPRRKVAGR